MRIKATLYGSLAFTGKGHATDRALAPGLLGWLPADLDPDQAEHDLTELGKMCVLHPQGLPRLNFNPAADIVFDYGLPPGHPKDFRRKRGYLGAISRPRE